MCGADEGSEPSVGRDDSARRPRRAGALGRRRAEVVAPYVLRPRRSGQASLAKGRGTAAEGGGGEIPPEHHRSYGIPPPLRGPPPFGKGGCRLRAGRGDGAPGSSRPTPTVSRRTKPPSPREVARRSRDGGSPPEACGERGDLLCTLSHSAPQYRYSLKVPPEPNYSPFLDDLSRGSRHVFKGAFRPAYLTAP